jgi:hypothetical protein
MKLKVISMGRSGVFGGPVLEKPLGIGWSSTMESILGGPSDLYLGGAGKSRTEYYEEGWSPSLLLDGAMVSQSGPGW